MTRNIPEFRRFTSLLDAKYTQNWLLVPSMYKTRDCSHRMT